jgi:hypothetical protein
MTAPKCVQGEELSTSIILLVLISKRVVIWNDSLKILWVYWISKVWVLHYNSISGTTKRWFRMGTRIIPSIDTGVSVMNKQTPAEREDISGHVATPSPSHQLVSWQHHCWFTLNSWSLISCGNLFGGEFIKYFLLSHFIESSNILDWDDYKMEWDLTSLSINLNVS